MRRRANPYSRRTAIDDSRRALRDIVVLVLLAGLLVNLVSGFLSDLLQRAIIRDNPVLQTVVYLLVLGSLVALVALFIFRYHSRAETSDVRLEVVVPYCYSRQDGLQVKLQHPYRPLYDAAHEARRIYNVAHRANAQEPRRLAAEWLDAPRPKRVQQYLAGTHRGLVDALLLQLLHKYGEDSLGPEAVYGWFGVPLAAQPWAFADLPPLLRDNPYIAAQQQDSAGWRLLLPGGMSLHIEDDERGRLWLLHHRYADVRIRCFVPPWARGSGRSNPAAVMVFNEPHPPKPGKPPETCEELWVLGTRVLVTASFAWTMLRRVDPYQRWATRLLTYLEEGLDWEYFLAGRGDRILTDVPWKLGDLPRDGSIWGKLDDIDRRLGRLESDR